MLTGWNTVMLKNNDNNQPIQPKYSGIIVKHWWLISILLIWGGVFLSKNNNVVEGFFRNWNENQF